MDIIFPFTVSQIIELTNIKTINSNRETGERVKRTIEAEIT